MTCKLCVGMTNVHTQQAYHDFAELVICYEVGEEIVGRMS